ncbi:MAG: phosphoribosylaminoimidazolesuccinocarboxamide synthase [Methanobrevibacter sp.]|jgi:phosphoribosylaminoimidazole-succinocarboxamide synthase|nr:phosphoribosylaminoimidazolesuccinocarboxamide synthase [Candidatus Methanovirga meridionalis]
MDKIGNLIYAGKAKDVYEYEDNNKVVVKFRDDISAGDGEKKDSLVKKGYYNSLISSKLFEVLEESSIKTQYLKLLKPQYILSKKLKMIPLEVISRNLAAGSLLRNFPFQEKQKLEPPIIQMDYKNDKYHDPMLNDDIIIALKISTKEELNEIRAITKKINHLLSKFLDEKEIILVDFKLEFGKDQDGNIVLGDEISPDTCRYWDKETLDTLDKDIFRKGQGNVMNAYEKVFNRVVDEDDLKKWNID